MLTGESSVESELELTILMPCLNEAETVATCVRAARAWLAGAGVAGEVLVADNGSTDGSQELAGAAGARVVSVTTAGYGAALGGGIASARGRFVVMGDADDSYDFGHLDAFVERLRSGDDLVIGNRFAGGIAPGAMPALHRYLGNPILSLAGRLMFGVPVRDFHCGLRGMRTDAIRALELRTTGMEFASEMVVRAALADLTISEVPTTLRPDGRTRPPHLRTWHDGWRHLRFLLLFSPRWLFLIPGIAMTVVGLILTTVLSFAGSISLGSVKFEVGTLVYSAALTLAGVQATSFALFTRIYAVAKGFLPRSDGLDRFAGRFRLERGLLIGIAVFVVGLGIAIISLVRWQQKSFGPLDTETQLRIVVPAALALVLGSWIVLCSFFLSILGLDKHIDMS
ncbi:MAG TPA: glycosyltransferase family 2 protein [Acidimicrobiia bacterium]|nr:glycosyltransferase family 2 protein [Acidimicrobiia bacterium]